MIRRTGILLSLTLLCLIPTQVLAAETGLAGVRLWETALQLLAKPAFGPPAYIGPIGLSVSREAAARPTPSAAPLPTAFPSAAATAVGRTGVLPGRSPTRPGAAIAPAPATAAQPPPEPVMVWLYKRPPNTLLVVELSAEGKVTGVIVDGVSPAVAETARGIRLRASYDDIVAVYGYPDQTVNEGQNLILRYLYDGLTFRLSSMRLVAMRLSANPLSPIPGGGGGVAAPRAVAPTPGRPAVAAPTPTPSATAPGRAIRPYYEVPPEEVEEKDD